MLAGEQHLAKEFIFLGKFLDITNETSHNILPPIL
jgi:hypothetical protein